MEEREVDMVAEEEEKAETKVKENEKKGETMHVKIETIGKRPDKIPPLVGYFPSGYDPLKYGAAHPEESPPPQPKVRIMRHKDKGQKRLQLVVSPNGSRVNFVGTNYSGEAATPQVCTYALGVLDKQSQTLKIVPIASNKIFRLEPRVEVPDSTDEEPTPEMKELKGKEDVNIKYGTKRSRRQAKKLDLLRQKADPETQDQLDVAIKKIEINKVALESADSEIARNIPPYDSAATTPQMAYPLDKIIFEGEWDYLLDILDRAEVTTGDYPSFVCNRVRRLEHIEDDEERKNLARVFSYITHLVKFKDKFSMEGHSSAKSHRIPSILNQKFSRMFASSETKRLPDEKKDLLISYVLVLTLIADDFRTDPTDIAKDLRMTAGSLRTYYEHLGCKLIRQGTTLATLPVPLHFSDMKKRRRRK